MVCRFFSWQKKNKIGKLCSLVNNKKKSLHGASLNMCGAKHKCAVVPHKMCVLPRTVVLSKVYVGQTARCLDIKLSTQEQ